MLGGGRVLEFETPEVLLSNARSHFSSLVDQSGVGEAEHLRMLVKNVKKYQQEEEGGIVNDTTKEEPDETDSLLFLT